MDLKLIQKELIKSGMFPYEQTICHCLESAPYDGMNMYGSCGYDGPCEPLGEHQSTCLDCNGLNYVCLPLDGIRLLSQLDSHRLRYTLHTCYYESQETKTECEIRDYLGNVIGYSTDKNTAEEAIYKAALMATKKLLKIQ